LSETLWKVSCSINLRNFLRSEGFNILFDIPWPLGLFEIIWEYENNQYVPAHQPSWRLMKVFFQKWKKINTTVDCISDTAITKHHIRMSAWNYYIKEKINFRNVMHTTCFPIYWLFNWLGPLPDGINRSIFLQLHLLKFMSCVHCSGLAPCRLCQIKHEV
jgi:hypothetical protein